jgi:hypothetical protein
VDLTAILWQRAFPAGLGGETGRPASTVSEVVTGVPTIRAHAIPAVVPGGFWVIASEYVQTFRAVYSGVPKSSVTAGTLHILDGRLISVFRSPPAS